MERRETDPQNPLLPIVSQETITEFYKIGNTQALDKIFEKTIAEIEKQSPGLANFFITNAKWGFSSFVAGGITVYILLANEAQKQGGQLPRIETLTQYFERHPWRPVVESALQQGTRPDIVSMELREAERKADYTPPSTNKFREENPKLMEWLEKKHRKLQKHAKTALEYTSNYVWYGGALTAYEILRFQAEKDRLATLFTN